MELVIRILYLGGEGDFPMWRVDANILNKYSQLADRL
jgi:hypothetical protein